MFSTKRIRQLLGCVVCFALWGDATASSGVAPWPQWLLSQVDNHPEVTAARERMNAAFSRGDAMTRALYNPELETQYEREGGDDNYRLGIRQRVDWWDRRGQRTLQAESVKVAARQAYLNARQDQLRRVLQALVSWEAANGKVQLARAQEQQLDELIALVRKRERAGDLGQIDVELSLLTLSQRLNDTAQAMAAFQIAQAQLRQLLPNWQVDKRAIPVSLWSTEFGESNEDDLLDNHPAVAAARAAWEIQLQQAQLARLEARAEPTVGLHAGRVGRDDVVELTLSVPLNLRNDYSAETRAAGDDALAAEATYRAIRRQQRFSLQADRAVLDQYRTQVVRWESLMSLSRDESKRLLERQWISGDLGTSEYLLALQQRMDGLRAGISLNERYRLAVIAWLSTSGQTAATLTQIQTQFQTSHLTQGASAHE